ncbi:MAG: signal peptide peptidase SppA [Bacteroidota bacterium]
MRSFLKIFLASFLALVVFTLIGSFIFGWFIEKAIEPDKPIIASKTVLVLDLSKPMMEQTRESGFSFPDGQTPSVNGLFDVIRAIKFASTDESVKGIYIKCANNPNGFATCEELRNALMHFKKAKKFVTAYSNTISQKAYYVANTADKVYCNPAGMLDWKGFSMQYTFFKGMLDKLEIKPDIFYAGQFKSASEPFREKQMTPANRLQSSVFINEMYGIFLQAAATKTGLDTAVLHQLANDFVMQHASDALRYKLVDGLKYDDEVKEEMQAKLGLDKTDKIAFMTMFDYIKAVDLNPGRADDKIALIYAEGEIVDGKGGDGAIGGETYTGILRKARLDSNVKAVVFRINSGGGSAMASEMMWREVTLTRKIKPVIVSMGDYAASGGYYIACNADSIFAQPNTLTGSIGVFSMYANVNGLMNNKLGVTFDGVKTSPSADFGSAFRLMTDKEKGVAQASVDSIYQLFKNRVSEGRKIPLTHVDSIAQGRIWSGTKAIQLKLADRVGGIQDAIDCAFRMARLTSYQLKELPVTQSFWDKIFNSKDNKTSMQTRLINAELGEEHAAILKQVQTVKSWFGTTQTRLPFFVTFN